MPGLPFKGPELRERFSKWLTAIPPPPIPDQSQHLLQFVTTKSGCDIPSVASARDSRAVGTLGLVFILSLRAAEAGLLPKGNSSSADCK